MVTTMKLMSFLKAKELGLLTIESLSEYKNVLFVTVFSILLYLKMIWLLAHQYTGLKEILLLFIKSQRPDCYCHDKQNFGTDC